MSECTHDCSTCSQNCEGRMDLRALPIFEFNRVRGKARSFLLASEL